MRPNTPSIRPTSASGVSAPHCAAVGIRIILAASGPPLTSYQLPQQDVLTLTAALAIVMRLDSSPASPASDSHPGEPPVA